MLGTKLSSAPDETTMMQPATAQGSGSARQHSVSHPIGKQERGEEVIEYHAETSQPPGIFQPVVPPAVRNAGRVMYAGAVACVIHVAVVLVTTDATKTAIRAKNPHLSADTVSTLTSIAVIATAVIAVIAAVLFVWIARACTRGKNWARITGTALAGLGVLFAIYDVSAGRGTASLIYSFVVAAIGLASVALLWQRSSGAWFRYFKRPEL
jgi:hypothetical protein